MSLESLPTYFLASNSADGFINGFSHAFDPKKGWRTYLIKGGPGTGKSGFMKKVAAYFSDRGETVEIVPCSSDPDSLDAVVLKDRYTVILDATAPHTVDPVYPGVSEEILDFGQFWDTDLLNLSREEIISLTDSNKALHKRASRIISAIGQINRNQLKLSLVATDIDKTFDFAVKLSGRYIKPCKSTASERVIYLSALTPRGEVFYGDTIDKMCDEKVVILDEYGTVSNIIFSCLRDYALKNGADIITVKNNILPGEQIDHILIPELSLAFCSSRNGMKINDDGVRKIHAERFMNRETLREARSRLHFGKRLSKELTDGAIAVLKEAKDVHDKLELCYIKSMDFERVNEFSRRFTESLFLN